MSSHLFQRVVSFRQKISKKTRRQDSMCSHLFQRVVSFRHNFKVCQQIVALLCSHLFQRVVSFRLNNIYKFTTFGTCSSHLFQRVVSFRPRIISFARSKRVARFSSLSESSFLPTLGFHDCLFMRILEREKGNLRNLVLV